MLHLLSYTLRFLFLLISFSFLVNKISAQLKVNKSLSSNMVFQRDQPIVIWGKAKANSPVKVSFGTEKQRTKASTEGTWEVTFPKQPANANPQFILIQSGESSLKLENILIGEVWFCAGQSNMVMRLPKTNDFKKA